MLQTLTFTAVSSWPNVIRLGTITKAQVYKLCAEYVIQRRSVQIQNYTATEWKSYKQYVGTKVSMIKEVVLFFYGRARTRVDWEWKFLSIVIRGREKAFSAINKNKYYRNNFVYVRSIVQIQKYRCCQLRPRVRVGVRISDFSIAIHLREKSILTTNTSNSRWRCYEIKKNWHTGVDALVKILLEEN